MGHQKFLRGHHQSLLNRLVQQNQVELMQTRLLSNVLQQELQLTGALKLLSAAHREAQ